VLTQVNGQSVNDVAALLQRIAQTNPGDEVRISLLRKTKEMNIRIQVGKRPKSKAKS